MFVGPLVSGAAMQNLLTERARKALQLANQEAHRLSDEYVGTVHILLGLIKEGFGTAARLLRMRKIDLRKVRREVEHRSRTGPPQPTMGRLPLTPRARNAIGIAVADALGQDHDFVGTGHLLLALLDDRDGEAAQILRSFGIGTDELRKQVSSANAQLDEAECLVAGCRWHDDAITKWLAPRERRFFEQAWPWFNLRVAFGGFVGALIGGSSGGTEGAAIGSSIGCMIGAFSWSVPAAFLGSLIGAAFGQAFLMNDAATFAGSVLGTSLAALVVQWLCDGTERNRPRP
jgi:hypothetical protein